MTIHITKPDVEWLVKLVKITEHIYREYPELFSEEDEEVLKITKQLVRSLL